VELGARRPLGRSRMGLGMERPLGRAGMGLGMESLGRARRLFGRAVLGNLLLGRTLLGWVLSLRCGSARDCRAAAAGLCAAGATTGTGVFLVLLPKPSRFLPLCSTVSARLDEGCSFSSAIGPKGVMVR
jgi:hypothetical protein